MTPESKRRLRAAICAIHIDPAFAAERTAALNLLDAIEVVDAPPAVGEVLRDELVALREFVINSSEPNSEGSPGRWENVCDAGAVTDRIDERIAAAASRAEAPGGSPSEERLEGARAAMRDLRAMFNQHCSHGPSMGCEVNGTMGTTATWIVSHNSFDAWVAELADQPAAPVQRAEAGGGATQDDEHPYEPDFDRMLIPGVDPDPVAAMRELCDAHNDLNEAVRELWNHVRALAAKVTT